MLKIVSLMLYTDIEFDTTKKIFFEILPAKIVISKNLEKIQRIFQNLTDFWTVHWTN